jgi:AcrR family transcriptional regulator
MPPASRDRRPEFVAAARRIVEDHGLAKLTWRSTAEAVGVSQTAGYRYFRDGLTELLAAMAIGGFRDLITYINRSPIAKGARDRVVEVSLRYVQFGVENPDLYRALFSPLLAGPLELNKERFDEGQIQRSSHDTYAELQRVKVEEAFGSIVEPLRIAQRAGILGGDDPAEYGLALAALVHGLVGEFIDEGLGLKQSRGNPWSAARRSMSRRIVELMLSGLEK